MQQQEQSQLIDHATLVQLLDEGRITATRCAARPDGWGIHFDSQGTSFSLIASRSKQIRVFKKLETVVVYLSDLGIYDFSIDATGHDPKTITTYRRPDAAERMKRALAAEDGLHAPVT